MSAYVYVSYLCICTHLHFLFSSFNEYFYHLFNRSHLHFYVFLYLSRYTLKTVIYPHTFNSSLTLQGSFLLPPFHICTFLLWLWKAGPHPPPYLRTYSIPQSSYLTGLPLCSDPLLVWTLVSLGCLTTREGERRHAHHFCVCKENEVLKKNLILTNYKMPLFTFLYKYIEIHKLLNFLKNKPIKMTPLFEQICFIIFLTKVYLLGSPSEGTTCSRPGL